MMLCPSSGLRSHYFNLLLLQAVLPPYHILSVDFGSTHACGRLYSHDFTVLGSSSCPVDRIQGEDGCYELDPDCVWKCFCQLVTQVLSNANMPPDRVNCLGISVQRNSLLIWDRKTSAPYCNIVTWQDLSSAGLAERLNKSVTFRSLRAAGRVLHWMTRLPRFKAMAAYRFKTTFACTRLKKLLDDRPMLLSACRNNLACYGCLETWLLWKLTDGKAFCTDVSCASASGMYDPFTRKWSYIISTSLGIPQEILPNVHPSSHVYGYITNGPLKTSPPAPPVPVTALIGDAQAATLAEHCLEPGQAKLTLGTGSFLNVNTGHQARAFAGGFYPVIGWDTGCSSVDDSPSELHCTQLKFSRRSSCPTYLLENSHQNTGTVIEWLRSEGLFHTYSELAEMLQRGDQLGLDERIAAGGVYYITAPPVLVHSLKMSLLREERSSRSKLIGPGGFLVGMKRISSEIDRLVVVRVALESIAFTVRQLLDQCPTEAANLLSPELRVNGNVALSDWLLQCIADVTGILIRRSEFEESSCLGAAIAAGVGVGIWTSYSTALKALYQTASKRLTETYADRTLPVISRNLATEFSPNTLRVQQVQARYRMWCRVRNTYIKKLQQSFQ
ncbi:unnamed protein product [Dicrocoelium dendriticum]|nr:unnamed protein product [Dicrocoelium dendriticum]